MALVTVVVFAVLPALHASRTTVVDVLKDGGRADTGRRATRVGGSAFLGLQLGLAIVLVAQIGIATLTSDQPSPTDARLDDPRVLTGTVTLPAARYATPDARRQFVTLLIERLRALPGVVDVALASHGPVGGTFERRLTIDGRPTDGATAARTVHGRGGEPGYFADARRRSGARARLQSGRRRPGRDRGPRQRALRDAPLPAATIRLGQRLAVAGPTDQGPPQWRTVVGVVPDIRQRPGQPAAVPIVYTPLLAAAPADATLFVRGTGDGASLTGAVRESLRQLDSLVPLDRARSLAARDPRRHVVLARVGHARQHRVPVGVRAGRGRALRRRLAPDGAPAARDRPADGARRRRRSTSPGWWWARWEERWRSGSCSGCSASPPGIGRSRLPGPRRRALNPASLGRSRRRARAHRGARLPAAGRPCDPDRAR